MVFLRDFRFGLRVLARNPGFAAAAITVMSLGIGATTAVFSVVRGVLLEPLPYADPSRLLLVRADAPGYMQDPELTGEEFEALRQRNDLFESVGSIHDSEGNLTEPNDMEAVTAASVSGDFLRTLGVAPILGRSPNDEFIKDGWFREVDISYDLWQRKFAGDPHVIGRSIDVNNIRMIVAGVLPRSLRLYLGHGVPVQTRVDIWFPQGAALKGMARSRTYITVARLRRGVSRERAQTAVDAMMTTFVPAHPGSYRAGAAQLRLADLNADVVRDVRPAIVALAGAVAFVLLIVSANLTNLLLARAATRAREIAVLAAIGASRLRIMRQLLAEGLCIGAFGAIGGVLLASWSVDALVALAPALPRRDAVVVDGTVIAVAITTALATALVVSLVPAWHTVRKDMTRQLKQDPNASRTAAMTRGLLVAAQLALSLVLLVGAGLMTRAFGTLRATPLGFDPRNALTMNVHLQVQTFNTGRDDEAAARRLRFYRQLADAVSRMSGVEQVGVGLPAPMADSPLIQRFSTEPEAPERQAEAVVALAGYPESLRVPLVAGRFFVREDDERPAAVIDEGLASTLWPGHTPVGQRLLLQPNGTHPQWAEVVGVARHVQMRADLRSGGLPQLWLSYAAKPYSDLNIVVRGRNPMALRAEIERAVAALKPGRPVHRVHMLDDYVADAMAPTRFALFVLGSFAGLAVLLSAIGVYGVVSYASARRTREIAIRLALGATRGRIFALVSSDSAVWVTAGVMAGVFGSRLLTRYLETLLFGISPKDIATFAIVSVLLIGITVAATVAPAAKATRIDPMLSLRAE
ncbi:MAG TPA: ABC transporter permease [Vicinamibacterales bacterium]